MSPVPGDGTGCIPRQGGGLTCGILKTQHPGNGKGGISYR